MAFAVLLPMAAQGDPGRPPITLGMSTALSGPAQSLGSGMKAGGARLLNANLLPYLMVRRAVHFGLSTQCMMMLGRSIDV